MVIIVAQRLFHVQQNATKSPESRRLSFQPVDFSVHGRRQHHAGGIPARLSEFMPEMLFGLGGDIPRSPFPLESGDEIAGEGHRIITGRSASGIVVASGERQDGAEPALFPPGPW
jgi:hypothetical protein